MVVNISFTELSDYIKCHYDKTLLFSRVSDKELCVSYEQPIIFKTIHVPINISIEKVSPDSVTIGYNGGFGIDLIIAGTMSVLKNQVPELSKVFVSEEGHKIRIDLSQLSQTKAIFEAISLKDIQILEDDVQVEASLKYHQE